MTSHLRDCVSFVNNRRVRRAFRALPAGHRLFAGLAALVLLVQGCASINTFPTIARAGGTVAVMIGGSEMVRKDDVAVTLTDGNSVPWDLQSLGLVRSVFNLRTDGRAKGLHYSSFLDTYFPWSVGHEPVQTVLVTDLPAGAATGQASLTISYDVADDSSGASDPLVVALEIISGTGTSDDFLRSSIGGPVAVNFTRLEPAPHAKISFGDAGSEQIGAVSLVVDFDETVLDPEDINVYVPESTVRGSVVNRGAFGETQRMVYWRQDGQQLLLDAVAPQGIEPRYLQLYILHPDNLSGPPDFSVTSATIYDVDGIEIAVPYTLTYFP